MSRDISLSHAARELYRHLSAARRREFALTLLLMFVGAIFEVATIGAVIPLLAVVTSEHPVGMAATAIDLLDRIALPLHLPRVAVATLLLCGVAIVSALLRMWLSWTTFRFAFTAARDMSATIYGRVLRQPYPWHVLHNSAETVAALDKVQQVLAYVILPGMLALTSIGVALFMIAALVALDPVIAAVSVALFAFLYIVTSLATNRRLERNSTIISQSIAGRIQAVQEGLGGIRDVILDRSQPVFLAKFMELDRRFRDAQTVNYFISAAPRFILEASSVILIAILALYLAGQPGGVVGALPMLGAMAVGAQRVLPLAQQIYASWSQYQGSRALVADVIELMGEADAPALPGLDGDVMPLEREIAFEGAGYRYPTGDRPALYDVDLVIARGERIGLIGESGSGKSTLADLLMGLLDPTSGALRVDGHLIDADAKPNWQRQIAHVPQGIFLADGSLAANIAFGQADGDIDMDRVRSAAARAELDTYIASLPDGYATQVGERGVRMSGGQRQRLGIARALYKRASVLVLDEATSALDDRTEASVMQSIDRLGDDLTIVMIAHRLSTLRKCDRIIRVADGRIVASGTYNEIVDDAA